VPCEGEPCGAGYLQLGLVMLLGSFADSILVLSSGNEAEITVFKKININ
jgi:hypothetical protein